MMRTFADTLPSVTNTRCPAKYVCAFEKLHLGAGDAPGYECLAAAGAADVPAVLLLQGRSGFTTQPELTPPLLPDER